MASDTEAPAPATAESSQLLPRSRRRVGIRPLSLAYPERAPSRGDRPPLARLVIASNRLPVTLSGSSEDGWTAHPAAGGLVTALTPVMRERGGVWVGWPGAPDAGETELRRAVVGGRAGPMGAAPGLRAVRLTSEERDRFYYGFSNGVLWPLLHGFPERCAPRAGQWEAYEKVNQRFARALDRAARPGDLVWVHDYHLMLVARELRRLGMRNRMAFFLHTPFPRPEVLERAAEHRALVRALLAFDLIGFQNVRDRDNFMEAAEEMAGDGATHSGMERAGLERAGLERAGLERPGPAEGMVARTGTFPISIDYDEFASGAEEHVVLAMAREIRRETGNRTLLLGVDRLDYTKGIPERLRGLDYALGRYPELRGRVVLKQLVVPSRESLDAYGDTRAAIEGLVDAVNRRWGRGDWQPVHYEYGTWDRSELLAHYRVADAGLVTPLNDGMNLVAKEYCAANAGSGVLILSAFAGAAAELGHGALLVNPSDPSMTGAAIRTAHFMSHGERRHRMASLKRAVRENHVHRWVDSFLAKAG